MPSTTTTTTAAVAVARGSGVSEYNPFHYLRPVMRSEEDDIRKGVFSQALRNLAASSLEVRRQWCATIQEVLTTNKRTGATSAKAAASKDCAHGVVNDPHRSTSDHLCPPAASLGTGTSSHSNEVITMLSCSHAEAPLTRTPGEPASPAMIASSSLTSPRQPTHDEAASVTTTAPLTEQPRDEHEQNSEETAAAAAHVSVGPKSAHDAAMETVSVSTSAVSAQRAYSSGAADAVPVTTTSVAAESTIIVAVASEFDHMTGAEASEYIAKYMRSLLDRVVGGSLNNLSAPALRVLCTMLHMDTRVRSKDALYNILASYYYTHCEKLGKRVSRSTFVDSQTYHDAKLMESISNKSSTSSAAGSGGSSAAGSRRRLATSTPAHAHEDAERVEGRGSSEKKQRVGESRRVEGGQAVGGGRVSGTSSMDGETATRRRKRRGRIRRQ